MDDISAFDRGILSKPVIRNSKVIKEFRLGELFSGPGGLALGAFSSTVETEKEILRISHGWASDYDFDSCETYKRNNGIHSQSVIVSDVKELNIDSLPDIDIFAYGFPCNDFSIVGEKKGFNGDYGPLYTYGLKVIEVHNPICFVAENVSGLSSSQDGLAFKKILTDLSTAGRGYDLTVHLYKSEEYGVSQTRHRIIIVGFRTDLNIKFSVPAPFTYNNYVPVSEILSSVSPDLKNNEFTKQSKDVVQRLMHILPGENVWNANLPDELKLNVKGAKLSQIYKRLHPDKPSYTITGSGGGGTHGYHWLEPRALTNRERARIQSFPDDYEFIGSKESVRKQIGMAVPPILSKVIFTSILKCISGIKYKCIPANIQFEREVSLF
jgi:DNA (cytosine-5)-methyltransferase 1